MSSKGGERCYGQSPWHDRAVSPPQDRLKAMLTCPPHCRMPEEVFSRRKPATFLSYPPLDSNSMSRKEACIAQQPMIKVPEPESEEEMPKMEVYSYEREEVYDPSNAYTHDPYVEAIYGVYEDDNNNTENLELQGSCHTMEVYGESSEEEEPEEERRAESPEERERYVDSDEEYDDENNNNNEDESEEDEEEEEPEDDDQALAVSKRLPPMNLDPMNPGMITLLQYSDNPERIPNTPFTEVEFIDEEYRNAKHMAKNYHKFLRDIHKEMEISLKPHPHYETPWQALAGSFNTKRVDIFSEFRLAYIFQRFGRNCLIEGSPYEEGLFEFGEAFAISATLKESLQSDVTAAYIKPLEHFLVKEWPELMMHDQHVESLAKKLRKASVDPKKHKEKGNDKDKTKKAVKNTNANNIGKKKADNPAGEDIEASIQEKLHKSEVARLRKAFSDERNNTLSLFQFFLTSEYSQLVKLMELAECHLEYHQESYNIYKQVIESLRSKVNTIRPPRDDRKILVDLELEQQPPGEDSSGGKGDQPPQRGGNKKEATTNADLDLSLIEESTTQDRHTSMRAKKIKEKSQHAAEFAANAPASARVPKQTRDANTAYHPRKKRPDPPPTHQCDCPTNQLLFLPTFPNVSSFGKPPPKPRQPPPKSQPSSASEEDTMDERAKESDRGEESDESEAPGDNGIQYVACRGKCPGCNDGSFYEPHDRYADKKRDKPKFKDFQRKIPPIGTTYEEFDEDQKGIHKPIPCRGPDHVTNGPCTCEREIAYRAKNKEQSKSFFEYRNYMEQTKPYGFIKQDIPKDTFEPGLRVDVGDMVDLQSKKDGDYMVRLCDGSERTGVIKAEAIHVIEEPRLDSCCRSRKDMDKSATSE